MGTDGDATRFATRTRPRVWVRVWVGGLGARDDLGLLV